jgi:hypothetical protein
LGDAARIERVDVRWPSGLEESWDGLTVDTFHVLKEGSGHGQPSGR